MSWLFSEPQQFQNDMLNHEQGHDDLTALLARDLFIDVMLLKGRTFATAQAGSKEFTQLKSGSINKLQALHQHMAEFIRTKFRRSRGSVAATLGRIHSTASRGTRDRYDVADGILHRLRIT